ncbi:MAG: BrnT family toxin [Candidatus Margulisiibacteriota bacterium]
MTFAESCYIFSDKYSLTIFDEYHSGEEKRWISLGATPKHKLLVVVFTYRQAKGEELVRIISARKATKNEVKQYFARRGK